MLWARDHLLGRTAIIGEARTATMDESSAKVESKRQILTSQRPLLAQLDRAPGFEPGGWGFKSLGAGQLHMVRSETWLTKYSGDIVDNFRAERVRSRARAAGLVAKSKSDVVMHEADEPEILDTKAGVASFESYQASTRRIAGGLVARKLVRAFICSSQCSSLMPLSSAAPSGEKLKISSCAASMMSAREILVPVK